MCTLNVTASLITYVINTVNDKRSAYKRRTILRNPEVRAPNSGYWKGINIIVKKTNKKNSVFRQTTNKQFLREHKILKQFFLAKINKNVQLSVEGSNQW